MRSSLLLVLFVLALCPGWLHAQCSVTAIGGVLTCAQQSVTLQITTTPQGLSWECFGPQGSFVSPTNPVVNVPGAYTVTVTDGLGCTNTATAFVTENAVFPNVSGVVSNVSCFGAANGGINLTVPGPSGPYSFNWSDSGNNTEDRTSLPAGVYTVTVTGSNGCETTGTFTVTQPVPLVVTTQTQNTNCSSNSGVITAAVSGGLPPYVYAWSNGTTTPTIGNLSAGLYCLTVTDANGCTTTTCTNVQAAGLDISSVVVKSDCPGATGGIDLSVSGGVGPYTFDWSDLPGTSDPEDRSSLATGTYTVTVSDEVGCTTVRSLVVGSNTAWTVSLATTNVSCFGGPDGAIGVTVSGAGGPFTFDWAHLPGTNNPEDLVNLAAGTYLVTVTDVSGCFNTASATVTQSSSINIAAVSTPTTTCLGPSGIIDITVTGGTAPYSYLWSHGWSLEDAIGLTAGVYCVTVTDVTGCTAVRCVDVVQIASIIVTATVQYLNCATTVQLTPTVTSGTGPYTYAWSGPNGYSNTTMSPLANSLGNYCVVVTDVTNGCTGSACVTVVPLLATATATPLNCGSTNSGVATATVSGGVAPYLFDWSNGANTQTIGNLAPGTYCVTVTDETGCFTTTCVDVVQQSGVSLQATTCGNEINGVVTGGTPVGGYTVVWAFNGAPQGITSTTNGAFTIPGDPGEYTIVVTDVNGCQATATVVIAPNPTPCTFISGTIKLDGNDNCTADPTELGASGWLVRAIGPSGTFYAFTDADGAYLIRVEPGTYTVTIDPLTLGSAQLCAPESYNVTLANAGDTALGNDFVAEEAPICPELTVSIGTPLLRRCFSSGNFYWVNWSNNGLATAEDAYVTVALDPFLTFNAASVPGIHLGNNVYRFNLGDVPPGAAGYFYVFVTVSCDAVLGQTHCTIATIYPNGPCEPPSPEWSGAEVDVRSECVSDSLHFILKNVGNAPMSSTLNYIVIEDGIMTRMGQTDPLAALDSMVVSVPANGSTWRVEADQEAFFPGFNLPVLSVEGCTNTGSFTTGWVQQFTSGVFAPWESSNCTNNIGSYDPNDKQGFPLGYGPEHYIRPGTPIDYLIRFQNTGTDTAFNIVIRDTLSAFLDPATVRVGASSHPYEFNFGGENVLVFDFKNILLPDSNVNLAGSQGFVQFRISPRASAPLESVIENQAAIYFDFNEPIFTNTTDHRLGENFVTVSLWEPREPLYQVRVSPNPLRSEARLEVLGVPVATAPAYRLQVFDLTGRLVQEMTGATPQFLLQKNTLDAGAYLFKVATNDGRLIGNGRLVVVE